MERERTRGIFNENTRVWACPKRETQHKASQRICTARYSYSQMDILRDSDNPRITVWITTCCCADYTPTFECDSWFRAVIAMKVKKHISWIFNNMLAPTSTSNKQNKHRRHANTHYWIVWTFAAWCWVARVILAEEPHTDHDRSRQRPGICVGQGAVEICMQVSPI